MCSAVYTWFSIILKNSVWLQRGLATVLCPTTVTCVRAGCAYLIVSFRQDCSSLEAPQRPCHGFLPHLPRHPCPLS